MTTNPLGDLLTRQMVALATNRRKPPRKPTPQLHFNSSAKLDPSQVIDRRPATAPPAGAARVGGDWMSGTDYIAGYEGYAAGKAGGNLGKTRPPRPKRGRP